MSEWQPAPPRTSGVPMTDLSQAAKAREVADGIMDWWWHTLPSPSYADLNARIAAALVAAHAEGVEAGAKVAEQRWTRRRSGSGIAASIRALIKENSDD